MEALERTATVNGIGLGEMDLSAVPRRRVVDLARTGMRANATDLRRMSRTPSASRRCSGPNRRDVRAARPRPVSGAPVRRVVPARDPVSGRRGYLVLDN